MDNRSPQRPDYGPERHRQIVYRLRPGQFRRSLRFYCALHQGSQAISRTLQQARGDGSHLKVLDRLSRVQLLILDDFLLTPLSDMERRDLLEITEGRYDGGASVIASQCPIPDWYAAIGDPTIADAICDRLLHTAYRLELRGDSMRKETGRNNEGRRLMDH